MTPTHQSRPRSHRCPNCHKTTTNRPLCEGCQADREAMQQALEYMWDIIHIIPTGQGFSVADAISATISKTRRQSPMIIQAVLDQAQWMEQPDYESITHLLQSETIACGVPA